MVELAIELRDTYQHRHPILAGVAEFSNDLALSEVCLGAVDAEASTGSRLPTKDETAGLLPVDGLDLLLPHALQRGLIDVLARTVAWVFAVLGWPDDGRWASSQDGLRWPEVEDHALRAFGAQTRRVSAPSGAEPIGQVVDEHMDWASPGCGAPSAVSSLRIRRAS
ncbi:MAG: hypothetical protein ACRD29_21935 [Acidimicrobiales bacterium]